VIRPAALLTLGATLGLAPPLAVQGRRCLLQMDNVDRQGVSTTVFGTNTTNYFAGGNVRMSCRGQNVRIWTDSVASYQGQVVQFIGNFRYEDETARVTSDFGTYYRDSERWEARGNVVATAPDGRRLTTEHLIYDKQANQITIDTAFIADGPTGRLTGNHAVSDIGFNNVIVQQPRGTQKGKGFLLPGQRPDSL
jgi:lipopolysaccharide assembly outer membrane protein LptD (OstA)